MPHIKDWTNFQKIAFPTLGVWLFLMVANGLTNVTHLIPVNDDIANFFGKMAGLATTFLAGVTITKVMIENDLGKEL